MQPFETADAYPVYLSATLSASENRRKIHLILRDAAGAHGAGVLDLDLHAQQTLPGHTINWACFLDDYRTNRSGTGDQQAFGQALLRAVLQADASLGQAWAAVLAGAAGRPLSLIVSFGSQTEAFAQLPLELLHDQGQFLFARPQAALTRCFEYEPAADFASPPPPASSSRGRGPTMPATDLTQAPTKPCYVSTSATGSRCCPTPASSL